MSFDDSTLAEARLHLIESLVRSGMESPKEVKAKAHSSWATSLESTAVSNKTVSNLQAQHDNIVTKIKELETQIAPAKGTKLKELLARKQEETSKLKAVAKQLAEHKHVNEGHAKHMLMWSTLATL